MEQTKLLLSEKQASMLLDLVVSYHNYLDRMWMRNFHKMTYEQKEQMREEFRVYEPLIHAMKNETTRQIEGVVIRGVPQWKRVVGE